MAADGQLWAVRLQFRLQWQATSPTLPQTLGGYENGSTRGIYSPGREGDESLTTEAPSEEQLRRAELAIKVLESYSRFLHGGK